MNKERQLSMCHRRARAAVKVLALFICVCIGTVHADDDEQALVTVTGTFTEEQYISGGEVVLNGVNGADLFVSGGTIVFNDVRAGDGAVAGGSVRFDQATVSNLFVAGGELEFDRLVAKDLVAAGGRIRLRRNVDVEGYATLAGAEIDLAGRIGGNLKAAGRRVAISATIEGNAHVVAARVVIGPEARIGGNLTYVSSAQAQIAPGAQIQGKVERHDAPEADISLVAIVGFVLIVWLVAVIGLAFMAMALQLGLPGLLDDAARTIKMRPWASLGLGFALLIAAPAAGSLFAFSVVGIPLAVVVYATCVPTFALGLTSIGYWLGCRSIRRAGGSAPGRTRRLMGTALGVLLLAVVVLLPLIGWLAALLGVATGTGALVLAAWRRWASRREAAVDPNPESQIDAPSA
ncbi:MAG: hypothetical protein ACR2RL_15470 [Gammaproteobacteria bacterium]